MWIHSSENHVLPVKEIDFVNKNLDEGLGPANPNNAVRENIRKTENHKRNRKYLGLENFFFNDSLIINILSEGNRKGIIPN